MSSFYPNTLDQRRLYNSDAKTLLQNWVEERQVEQFDKIPEEHFKANKPAIQYFKEGHKGILTVENQAPYSKYTTYNKDYVIKSNYDPNGEPKGIRYKLTEQAIRNKLIKEMESESGFDNDYFDESTNFVSEAREKFNVPGFVHQPPRPTVRHDLYAEMPVSFWTEHKDKAHGVTQVKTLDTPFRRNAAFSTPGSDSFDQAKPGELENYPYMSQKNHNNTAIL